MGYGDYTGHLMDQDPVLYPSYHAQTAHVAVGTPAPIHAAPNAYDAWQHRKPTSPSAPPEPPAWHARHAAMEAPEARLAPHQRRLALAVAREHGRSFKTELRNLHQSAANAREVCALLKKGRTLWQALPPNPRTVGIMLKLTPTRLAITPDGFYVVTHTPTPQAPGRLADLCSAEFKDVGTPQDFLQQVNSELNSVLRRRSEISRELMLFHAPSKRLHTCRAM